MEYEDTIDVKIEAFKPSGGKGVQIVLGDTLTPDITYKPYPAFLNETYNKRKIKANNRRERMDFKTKLKNKPEEDNIVGKIHETPNDVMKVGDDVNSYSNILQYMQGKVPGVNIVGNRVIIRGVSTFYGSTDPLFLMDGVPIDASTVPSINPSDINRIEILKGPEASIYGSRGANGVIAFYSKRGQFMKRGVIEFGMLGYHKTREFYVPAYDSWTYKPIDYNVPRTLFWKPMIKTDSTGSATIKFTKKFTTEKFSVGLEGITNSGDLIYFKSEQ
jgi:TonB-dependent SusC/RagA subfamily outer membrane receptor